MIELAALVALAAAPAAGAEIDTGVFGVRLGAAPDAAQAAFAPDGDATRATWTVEKHGRLETRAYRCDAKARCFTLPVRATLCFLDGRLVAVTLDVDQASAPPNRIAVRALERLKIALGLGPPAARSRAVGRVVSYYFRDRHTLVWVQDGPDAELKLYLDAGAPVGRAEAVAAGAPPQGLEKLRGGKAYAAAHGAIGRRDWRQAASILDELLGDAQISPLLAEQARLVLAMVLAARAKSGAGGDAAWRAKARRDLSRARELAPGLAGDLDGLAAELGLVAD